MAAVEDYDFSQGEAGASETIPMEAGQIRKGGLIMIKGAVPGSKGGWILVRDAVKRARPDEAPVPGAFKAPANDVAAAPVEEAPAPEAQAEGSAE